ncbi:MAG: hypothetical protein JWN44_3155 [Myxococcales bacterium]|nr:hypothetical protein [Myxococcales bacterium]
MWSCDTCGRPNKSNPLICETCGAAAPGADAGQVSLALQRDLTMEAHLRALAFWYRAGAVLLIAGGVSLLGLFGWLGSTVMRDTSAWRGSGAMWAGAIGYLATFVLAAAAGSWVLGHFLARFVNGARIAAGILTLVSLLVAGGRFVFTAIIYSRVSDDLYGGSMYFSRPSLAGPIATFILSTIWSVAIAYTLFSGRAAQVCAPAYRTIVARTAAMRAPMAKSAFFVIPLVGTMLVVLMLLMVFVRLHSYRGY